MLLLPLDCRQELEVLKVLNLLVQPLAGIGLHLLQVVLVTHVVLGLVVDLLRQDVQVLVLSQAFGIACNILQIYILVQLKYGTFFKPSCIAVRKRSAVE